MLIIIHGDDVASSRRKLRELVDENKDDEKIFLDGRKLTLEELVLACESSSMLFNKKLIVIENFLGSPKNKNKENIISYLNCECENSDIILWDDKKIDKRTFAVSLKKYAEYPLMLPANLFKFLDSIGVDQRNLIVGMFHSLLATLEAEMIFSMLVRQWRNMIIAIDANKLNPAGLASWQLGKLRAQARVFGNNKLISSYRTLLTIDYKIKSGLTPFSMRQLLDIFFLNL